MSKKAKRVVKAIIISPHAIVHGSLQAGYDIIGPFENYQDAKAYCEASNFSHAVEIVRLVTPIGGHYGYGKLS